VRWGLRLRGEFGGGAWVGSVFGGFVGTGLGLLGRRVWGGLAPSPGRRGFLSLMWEGLAVCIRFFGVGARFCRGTWRRAGGRGLVLWLLTSVGVGRLVFAFCVWGWVACSVALCWVLGVLWLGRRLGCQRGGGTRGLFGWLGLGGWSLGLFVFFLWGGGVWVAWAGFSVACWVVAGEGLVGVGGVVRVGPGGVGCVFGAGGWVFFLL